MIDGCDHVPMDADEIRRVYLEFMVEQGHVVIPRAPLIPKDDPTTLFTGSGMQPLLPYLLGADHPAGHRLTDSQTCLRVQDIEEVGDNRHTTFFEMLGNWSLGDYFKDQQLHQFWTFLTEKVGLDPNRIYVTCFIGDEANGIPKDTESAEIWTELFTAAGVSADQVELGTRGARRRGRQPAAPGSRSTARRTGGAAAARPRTCRSASPADPTPRSSTSTRRSSTTRPTARTATRTAIAAASSNSATRSSWSTSGPRPVSNRCPARTSTTAAAWRGSRPPSMDSPDVFRINLLWPIIEKLEELSGKSYENETVAMRVIADHLRGATFLAVDGVRPSNKAQGYVMRRLIRRAVRYAFDLGLEQNFFPQIIPTIAGIYDARLPGGRASAATRSIAVLVKEEKAFRQTLRKGIKQLKRLRARRASPAPSCSPCTTPSGSRSS